MTQRLVYMVRQDWASFDGLLASDPLELPFDRFLNKIYWWATRNAVEQSDLDRFVRKLWMPPVGVAPAPGSPWSPEAETAAFQDLAAAFGTGGKPASVEDS